MPYANLICTTSLVEHTVKLLQQSEGCVGIERILHEVFGITNASSDLATNLISDLAARDPRLSLNEKHIELNQDIFSANNLNAATFTVFDLETTGASAPPCRITEIGAVKIEAGRITDAFHTMVDPQCPIPSFISQLTGITDEMVTGAPKFVDVMSSFLGFIGDSIVVAHNAQFDLRFLNYEIGMIHEEYRLGNQHLCTVQLSKKLMPDLENHRLNTLARHFSIPLVNHHRASDDARATAEIFLNLLDMLSAIGITNLDEVRTLRRPATTTAGAR